MSSSLTILIAEDSAADRLLLSSIVSRQGHRVLSASNGLEAVELFIAERPQLVLMDALMPLMDGFEAAQRIKQLAGEALVPIIFLTSLTEGEALVRCLEVGGDDFLPKPYNQVILAAKIQAMDRLRRLQDTVLQQRDLIAKHHEHLLSEQRIAKAVFDKVAHSGCLSAANIRYLQSPFALFNGDLLLAAYTPSGNMHVLLGDFTGHGLPAAIGAMPLAEVFYGMTAKGHVMADILSEINTKLKRILPVEVFCCASMLHLNAQQRTVEAWLGGLPDGYLCRADSQEKLPLVSSHLPLGILPAERFVVETQVFQMAAGDRLILLTDGLLELSNRRGEIFGDERLQQLFAQNQQVERLFDELSQALNAFHQEAQDDISLIEIALPVESAPLQSVPMVQQDSGQASPLDWSLSIEWRGETLQRFNPLPSLLQLLLEVEPLRPASGALYTLLSELYSNALEHGVLGLDSSLKASAQGFCAYYHERAQRLQCLREGYVRFHFELNPEGQAGCLRIRVEDSGPGFDLDQVRLQQGRDRLSGRGMNLIAQLGTNVLSAKDGRGVSVDFLWAEPL